MYDVMRELTLSLCLPSMSITADTWSHVWHMKYHYCTTNDFTIRKKQSLCIISNVRRNCAELMDFFVVVHTSIVSAVITFGVQGFDFGLG